MPCPFGVDIPYNFSVWNEGAMFGIPEKAKAAYRQEIGEAARADPVSEVRKMRERLPSGNCHPGGLRAGGGGAGG